jgi:AmmeMemoRadiSam system protein B/AmmeMemoRadiSam system protein A
MSSNSAKVQRLALWLLFCLVVLPPLSKAQRVQVDRQPAVAGQFYPGSETELRSMLKGLFSRAAPSKGLKNVVAVIAPHAGYVFSGEVAASSFNQIDLTKHYDNIFVLGPSHHVAFDGGAIYSKGDFITPLGRVKVNTRLAQELIDKNDIFVSRDDAHLAEHSVEVQLPFLQYRLGKDFSIVPIVVGASSPESCRKIAEALRPFFNLNNLFVISTDFSHYPPYDDAVRADKRTADAIVSRSPENLINAMRSNANAGIPNFATSLCGWPCVLTLLYLVEDDPGIEMSIIRYRNSGDSEYGQKNQVVGYCAIAVSLKEKKESDRYDFNEQEKKTLLQIARGAVAHYVKNRGVDEIDATTLPAALKARCGAFVTLREKDALRGCIGRFDAAEPLYRVVQQMAVAAATQDYRFPPVEPQELDRLEIEISVLTPLRKIASIDEIQLGRDGIYIKKGMKAGTFLPEVATETGWSREEFLGHCAQDKAGIGWDGWKDAEIYVYEAKVFGEKDLK